VTTAAPVRTRPRSPVRVVVTPQLPPDAVARTDDELSGDAAAQRDQSMLERVRAKYDLRLEVYRKALNGRAAPFLEVTNDDVKELVVLDGSLWQQLFDIYLYHGWDGIQRVDRGIRALFQVTIPPTSVWVPARRFFEETHALLGGMVRDALVELERASAARMTTNLSVSAVAVEKAWARYGITRTVRTETRPVPVSVPDVTVEEEVETFQFGNEAQTQTLFESLTVAVRRRTEYEAELQRVANLREHVQRLRATAERFRKRGRPLSSDAQLTRELDFKDEEAKTLEEKATALYRGMLAVVNDHSPLGLLALEGLAPGFQRAEMESLLGAILWQTHARLDTLGGQVDADRSKVRGLLPGTAFADLDGRSPANASGALVVPVEGPERAVINAALDRFGNDGGWFPVIHEATLHQLVEAGEIGPDSWLFVVWNRYVTALARVLGERRQDDEAWASFWSGFSKAAAAASLTLLATPAAKVGVVLRGAVAVADLVLLLHTVMSVTGQLARLEELQNQQVLHPDAFSVEGLGRLGELGAYRRQLLEGMAQQVLIELALIATGARWPVVKEALMLRGYLQDLETLLAEE
jgi:hypothetical protein